MSYTDRQQLEAILNDDAQHEKYMERAKKEGGISDEVAAARRWDKFRNDNVVELTFIMARILRDNPTV